MAPGPTRRRWPSPDFGRGGAPGFWANLARRVGTAAVGLPLLLLGFFKAPPLVGVAIVSAAALLALAEFYGLLAERDVKPLRATGYLVMAVAFVEVASPSAGGPSFWPLLVVLVLAVPLAARTPIAEAVPTVAGTLLGAVYVGALTGAIAGLHVAQPLQEGPWRVALLFASVMLSDTMAFFTGHAFGRHKLAPAVSPGKTIEGAMGGLLGGLAGALAVRAIGLPNLPAAHAVLLGLLTAALGIVGDLVESLLKRWAGVKDSGGLFPGHGGMLDRLDSLLFGAPVLYYYFVLTR